MSNSGAIITTLPATVGTEVFIGCRYESQTQSSESFYLSSSGYIGFTMWPYMIASAKCTSFILVFLGFVHTFFRPYQCLFWSHRLPLFYCESRYRCQCISFCCFSLWKSPQIVYFFFKIFFKGVKFQPIRCQILANLLHTFILLFHLHYLVVWLEQDVYNSLNSSCSLSNDLMQPSN